MLKVSNLSVNNVVIIKYSCVGILRVINLVMNMKDNTDLFHLVIVNGGELGFQPTYEAM